LSARIGYLHQSPIQNPSNSACGDAANSRRPRLDHEVDHHFCCDDHQKRDDGAEQNENRDNRTGRPISNTAH
jgi:hypothetical protein